MAQWLDDATATLTGEPIRLSDDVAADNTLSWSGVSAASTGTVAFLEGEGSLRRLTWFDRSGAVRGTVGDADATKLRSPSLSPDGRRVAVSRTVQGNEDLWLIDGARMSRFTFDAASENFAVWSPDGSRIAFRSKRSGPGDIYQKLTSGAAVEQVVRSGGAGGVATPFSWSADGRFLLYMLTGEGARDVWVAPMVGESTPRAFLSTPFQEMWSAFSPDGRWVAYMSDQSGRHEIYVRPFVSSGAVRPLSGQAATDASGQWQVSTAGGTFPVWRRDGKEVYYLSPAAEMMAAPIVVTGAALEPGAPVKLFQTRIVGGGADAGLGPQYDVAGDGRFLINTMVQSAAMPITIIQNWRPEGKK